MKLPYSNECEFLVEQTNGNPNLGIDRQGVCWEADEIDCDAEDRPVCGMDMKTYSNECELYVERIRTKNPTLKVAFEGNCFWENQ